jgi:hypothetical protein
MLSPSPPRVNDGTRTLSVRDRLGGEGRAAPSRGLPTARCLRTGKAIQETTPRLAMPDNGSGDLTPQTVAELRRLARLRPRSGREAAAKASALRTLERLNRGKLQVPPMPEGRYPHQPGDPFYQLDWVFLHEHPEILRRHWEAAWREGECECPGLLLPQTHGFEGFVGGCGAAIRNTRDRCDP